ncbi:MAG: YdcF family protein [Eubacteriales bacterium]|nr:YdcF family protein [Bacillota bacterium]MBV1726782.1 YdcF family protein [Desulforudis sp.]MDQ7789743.1 YdcF family protein [Clostridia bacterium]MDZ4042994.1 YdcF family protein [Eubacteriales bacterium]MBV1735819.1 YdcF family protein [Desulforudis sp.]
MNPLNSLRSNRKPKKGKKGNLKDHSRPTAFVRLQRLGKQLAVLCVVLLVIVGVGWLLLPLAGQYLLVDQEVDRVDVIVVLSGDRGERMEHGADLFHLGTADRVIVSGGAIYQETAAADLMFRHAVGLGVPAASVIKEAQAQTTEENALFIKQLMDDYGFESAVVVSSPYHMRRVQMVFEPVFKEDRSRLIYSAAPSRSFDPNRWWETGFGKRIVISELAKVVSLHLPARWRGAFEDV